MTGKNKFEQRETEIIESNGHWDRSDAIKDKWRKGGKRRNNKRTGYWKNVTDVIVRGKGWRKKEG